MKAENYRTAIVEIAESLIGAPSVRYAGRERGQSPEEGFDCSGFARFVLLQAGLIIPDHITITGERHTTRNVNQLFDYYGIHTHSGMHQGGDLIFFSKNGQVPTHIGIVLDEERYVHAPGKDGTRVAVSKIAEKAIRQTGEARKLYSTNPIGFKSPIVPVMPPAVRYHHKTA